MALVASARETCFAQIRTDLAAITQGATYNNTIRQVYRDLRGIDDIDTFPCIVMVEGGENEERTASSQRRFYLAELTLLVYFQAPTANISTALNSLYADVLYAMTSSSTYHHPASGADTCLRTIYKGMDPLAVDGAAICGFSMEFDIHIDNTWAQP